VQYPWTILRISIENRTGNPFNIMHRLNIIYQDIYRQTVFKRDIFIDIKRGKIARHAVKAKHKNYQRKDVDGPSLEGG
jgi:hypothetical protein